MIVAIAVVDRVFRLITFGAVISRGTSVSEDKNDKEGRIAGEKNAVVEQSEQEDEQNERDAVEQEDVKKRQEEVGTNCEPVDSTEQTGQEKSRIVNNEIDEDGIVELCTELSRLTIKKVEIFTGVGEKIEKH